MTETKELTKGERAKKHMEVAGYLIQNGYPATPLGLFSHNDMHLSISVYSFQEIPKLIQLMSVKYPTEVKGWRDTKGKMTRQDKIDLGQITFLKEGIEVDHAKHELTDVILDDGEVGIVAHRVNTGAK